MSSQPAKKKSSLGNSNTGNASLQSQERARIMRRHLVRRRRNILKLSKQTKRGEMRLTRLLTKLSKATMFVAIGMTLLFLSSCATHCDKLDKELVYVPVIRTPPADLLEPCEIPKIDVITNGQMLKLILTLHAATKNCAAKVQAINNFYKQTEELAQ